MTRSTVRGTGLRTDGHSRKEREEKWQELYHYGVDLQYTTGGGARAANKRQRRHCARAADVHTTLPRHYLEKKGNLICFENQVHGGVSVIEVARSLRWDSCPQNHIVGRTRDRRSRTTWKQLHDK